MRPIVKVAFGILSNFRLVFGLLSTDAALDTTLIPKIDLHKSPAEIASALKDAADADGPGFFYLFNHDVPESVFQNAVRESHKFHSLPLRKKLEISAVGYGGGTSTTKGYVPPLAEGAYDKDASDTRPDAEKASGKKNVREVLVFRYPEEEDVQGNNYFEDYVKFLKEFDELPQQHVDAASNVHIQNSTFQFSHRDNRVDEVEKIHRSARRFFMQNQWPKSSPGFRAAMHKYFEEMLRLARTMFGVFSQAVSQNAVHNLGTSNQSEMIPHDKGMMTFNLVHYPVWKENDDAMGIVDHSDWEAFTLLYPGYLESKHVGAECSITDDNLKDEVCSSLTKVNPNIDGQTGIAFTGLEVWFQDRWVAVPHIPGAIIVNQGEMLSRLSNGQFKAPVHRVQAKNAFPRYSLISFWAPNYDVLLPDPDLPYGKVLAGEHYLRRNHMIS